MSSHVTISQDWIYRWAPRLGPDAFVLLMWMVSEVSRVGAVELFGQSEIGITLGIGGEKSVRAALRTLAEHGFVDSRKRYLFDRDSGRTVRNPDGYFVTMEAPAAHSEPGRNDHMSSALAVVETSILPTSEYLLAQARAEQPHHKVITATHYRSVICLLRNEKGYTVRMIADWLAERGVSVSGAGIYQILQRDRVHRRALERRGFAVEVAK